MPSRQTKRRPGASQLIANANEYGASSGVPFRTVEGKTSSSSAIGPIVASMRAPRITMPLSSSETTCAPSVRPSTCCGGADAAVGLRRDERVRREEVLLADLLVVAARVLAVRRIGLGELALRLAEGHERAVEVVARAAERAEAVVGPALEAGAARDEVLVRARDEEGRADAARRSSATRRSDVGARMCCRSYSWAYVSTTLRNAGCSGTAR